MLDPVLRTATDLDQAAHKHNDSILAAAPRSLWGYASTASESSDSQ